MRFLALLIALPLFLSGCVTHAPRGELSDAMEASASGDGERSRSDGRRDSPDPARERFRSSAAHHQGRGGSHFFEDLADDGIWRMTMDFSYLAPLNGPIEGITRFTITPLGLEDGRNFVGFYLGTGWVDFKSGSLPDRAVRSARISEFGVSYRRYLNDPHVFLSPYLATHLAWQPLHWTYRSPVSSNADIITTDRLSAINGYAGLGVALWRAKHVSLFTEAGFGGTVYWTTTCEGFRNNVFDDFGYVTVKTGLTVRF